MAPKKKSPYVDSNGNPLPRCTEILNTLGYNKQALIAWARKQGMSGQDPNETKTAAANLGTLVHKYIENHVKESLGKYETDVDISDYSFEAIVLAKKAFDRYTEFESKYIKKYVDSEIKVIDETLGWGGTADTLFISMDGILTLGDFKTSKGVYADHIIQVSAYEKGLIGMGHQIKDRKIIHIAKDIELIGDMEPVKIVSITDEQIECGWGAFERAKWLYDNKSKLEPKE
jgi:hypothetical protein